MFRIRRYLKPYMLMFVASVILLFAQANFDLALPDYLSRIVNTGIQQSGVEDTVPEAMRQQTLDRLVLFLSSEEETAVRLKVFPPYQVNQQLVNLAKPDCLVMHCLPAHRGEEITDEVADGPNSILFPQAANRLHAQKAILVELMGNG